MVPGYALMEGTVLTWEGYLPPELRVFTMPFKLNQDRRPPPRQKHKVANWPAYEAGLRQRGSVTVWLTEAIAAWEKQRQGRCEVGQPLYSALAILTALTNMVCH